VGEVYTSSAAVPGLCITIGALCRLVRRQDAGNAMEDRLTELEIKLNLTEDMVEELNRTIYRQQQQIDLLQHQLRHLFQQMQPDAEPSEPRNLRDEIPPHY
jgi:SlyX protein